MIHALGVCMYIYYGNNAKPNPAMGVVSKALGEKTTILPPKATHNRGYFTVTPFYSVHLVDKVYCRMRSGRPGDLRNKEASGPVLNVQWNAKLSSRSRHEASSTTLFTKVRSPWRSIIRKVVNGLYRRAQALRLHRTSWWYLTRPDWRQ